MTTEIRIGETPVKLCGNAATAVRYKQVFRKDLLMAFKDMGADKIDADIIKELAYIMKLQAEGADFNGVTFDDYIEWLVGFEEIDIINNAPNIINVWMSNTQSMAKAKKK